MLLWSQNCPNTENFTQLEVPEVKFSMGLSEYSFLAHELDSTEKFVPIIERFNLHFEPHATVVFRPNVQVTGDRGS
jgi:hypothetical protein